MKRLRPFQLVILIISVIAIIVSVAIFAFGRGTSTRSAQLITVWGTMPQATFVSLVNDVLERDRKSINVEYVQKEPGFFDSEFSESLAEGIGPDVVILPQDLILRHQNKLYTVSYEFYPQRTFKDTFIEEGELFTHSEGILGFPLTVDPMVMYWNRSTFSQNGISRAPQYWDEILDITTALTKKDSSFNISKSAVALGEFRNISSAKEIFTTLVLQAGNPIVIRDEGNSDNKVFDNYGVIFDQRLGYKIRPAEAAANFFTQFSNPSKDVYSWNRALPNSQEMFISGDLAIYFGFASELDTLRKKNPNLNFDVAIMPQSRSGQVATFGKMQALAITRNTPYIQDAFAAILKLTDASTLSTLEELVFLPPVRRDLLSVQPSDAFMTTFYASALRSKAFYDISPDETESIFQGMIESIISGREGSSGSVARAAEEMKDLIR
jgi:ABC-type glycerol-3-phosphate transport system substrate-binding protein